MLTISHLEVEVCVNCVRILQMLMIFLLHVEPNFAQFSAAYLRHVPWAPELFSLVLRDGLVSRESAHEKCLARKLYDAQGENNCRLFFEVTSTCVGFKNLHQRFKPSTFYGRGFLAQRGYSGHSLCSTRLCSNKKKGGGRHDLLLP